MEGQPTLPVPEVYPVSLDELLGNWLQSVTGKASCVAQHAGGVGEHHAQDLTSTRREGRHPAPRHLHLVSLSVAVDVQIHAATARLTRKIGVGAVG